MEKLNKIHKEIQSKFDLCAKKFPFINKKMQDKTEDPITPATKADNKKMLDKTRDPITPATKAGNKKMQDKTQDPITPATKANTYWNITSLQLLSIVIGLIGGLSFIIYGIKREPVIVFKRLRSLKKSYKTGDKLKTEIPKVYNKAELELLHKYYNGSIRKDPLLVEGNSGIGKTFAFKELVQKHRKKYGEAAYISLKHEKGERGNLDAIEESMSKQLGVDYMTENKEWLEYKTMRKSPNGLWKIYNLIDIFTFRRLFGLNKINYHPCRIIICGWFGKVLEDKMPPLLVVDDIQVLINPMKADNESWDAIYTTLGNLYNLAYKGYAIVIFGSSEASVYKHMLNVHGAGMRIKLIRIDEKSKEIMIKYLTNEFNEAKKKMIHEEIINSEEYKKLERMEQKEYLEKKENAELKGKLFTDQSAEFYYEKIGTNLRLLEDYLRSNITIEEFIDNLIENYGIKRIKDLLYSLAKPKRNKAIEILEDVYKRTLISKKDDDENNDLIDKLIESNVLRQIGAKYLYTWHSPIINSGYEIFRVQNGEENPKI